MTTCPSWCNDHMGSNPSHHRSTRRQILERTTVEAIELFGAEHNRGIELFEHGSSLSLLGQHDATFVREGYIADAAALLNAAAALGAAIEEVWGS